MEESKLLETEKVCEVRERERKTESERERKRSKTEKRANN